MNPQTPPERNATVAFCQNCGKPLTAEERRIVAQAVFCEPCLAERLAAAPPPPGSAYSYPTPAAPAANAPNPGLAALLGFIPGVGAMYNGQYAKGVVHLIVFAVLVSVSDQHGIFGLFVTGWIGYQVIEAYHTARARRDGTPLPNPFGLNDLGERLGFGRSWPSGSPTSPAGAPGVPPSAAPPPPVGAEIPRPASDREGYAWGQATGSQATGGQATGSHATGSRSGWQAARDPFSAPPVSGVPPMPQDAPYTAVPPVQPVQPVYDPPFAPPNRFPTGALWLIGLGVLFLIGNGGLFRGIRLYHLLPVLLIGLGVWIFVQQMLKTGSGFADDGTPGYRRRLFNALRGSIWVAFAGVLFLLDSTHILSWGRSWPLWIILAGVMTFLQRTIPPGPSRMPGAYAYPPPPAYPVSAAPEYSTPESAAPAPAASGSAASGFSASAPAAPGIVAAPHDEEGRQL